MTFLFILFLALLLAILNLTRGKSPQRRTKKVVARIERKTPLAHDYPILYVYAGVRGLVLAASIIAGALLARPWANYASIYRDYHAKAVALHVTPLPLQSMLAIGLTAYVVIFLVGLTIILYVVTARKIKRLRLVLWLLLAFEVTNLVFAHARPNIYLIVRLLQAGVTAFTLWCIVNKKRYFSSVFRRTA